jgi:hypothetical protein
MQVTRILDVKRKYETLLEILDFRQEVTQVFPFLECPETSVINHSSTLRYTAEKQRPYLTLTYVDNYKCENFIIHEILSRFV